MQMMFTVYIVVLNAILSKFCDEAVQVLGLYYKLQSFFFIPLFGLQTCIVPVISFNYARKNYNRDVRIMNDTLIISAVFMLLGVICFEFSQGRLSAYSQGTRKRLKSARPHFV